MDEGHRNDPDRLSEFDESSDELDLDLDDDLWTEMGARRGPRAPAEGVRIIGAEEAAAAFESGHVARRVPEDSPRFGDVPPSPSGPRPPLTFPGDDPTAVTKPAVAPRPRAEPEPYVDSSFWDDDGDEGDDPFAPRRGADADLLDEELFGEPAEPRGRGGRSGLRGATDDPEATGALPHWTEPPSGEVPRILGDEDEGDDLNAWSSLAARPRWRDQPTDWERGDFDESILGDEDHRLGALQSGPQGGSPFSFDDEPEPESPPPPPAGTSRVSSRPSTAPRPPAEPGGGRGGSEVSTRILTGVIAGAVVLVAALVGPAALAFLIGVVLVLAVAEFYQALRTRGYHPATLLGLVGTAAIVAGVYWRGETAMPLVLTLFVVFTFLWYVAGVVKARPTVNVAVTLLPFLYVGFLGSFAALILTAGSPGVRVLVGAIIATVANDVGAFFVGRWKGRRPLAPDISPNKTVEGLIGATVVTFVVCQLVVRFIEPWDGGMAFWLALVVSAAAPLGDLCESMLKRDLGVKDMGSLLPGHGGVLDRIDGLLLVIPSTYYLLRLL